MIKFANNSKEITGNEIRDNGGKSINQSKLLYGAYLFPPTGLKAEQEREKYAF